MKLAKMLKKLFLFADFCIMSQAGDNRILQKLRSNRPTIVICGMVLGAHFGWRWLQNQPGVRHPDAPIDQDVGEDWPIVRVRESLLRLTSVYYVSISKYTQVLTVV